MLHRLQRDVLPDALPRAASACRAGSTPTRPTSAGTSGTWSRRSAPSSSRCRSLVFIVQRDQDARAGGAGAGRPVGRRARSSGRSRRRRPVYNFARVPDGARPRRLLAAEVRRRARRAPPRPSRPRRPRRRSRRSTCRRRRTGRSLLGARARGHDLRAADQHVPGRRRAGCLTLYLHVQVRAWSCTGPAAGHGH